MTQPQLEQTTSYLCTQQRRERTDRHLRRVNRNKVKATVKTWGKALLIVTMAIALAMIAEWR